MKGINKVILIGRLGKDPEVQRFSSGAVKAAFSLATSESYKNRDGVWIESTEWHNIVVWRYAAEFAEKYLRKGNLVYLEGKIKTRSWEDQSGNKKYITEIEARDLQSLERRSDNTGGGGNYQNQNQQAAQQPAATNTYQPAQQPTPPPVTDTVVDEVDDLPF